MENNDDHSDETALVTLGRIEVADVPDLGYSGWHPTKEAQDNWKENRKAAYILAPFTGALGSLFLYMMLTFPGTAPLGLIILTCAIIATCYGGPIAMWGTSTWKLAKLGDPDLLLPSGSSPELAEREHATITRIEAHNRNVRKLRNRSDATEVEIEQALLEDRALRNDALALSEAKTEIAGLLTDGT